MARISNAAQLLAAAALKREELQLPNGDTVLVRELSAGERPNLFQLAKADPARSYLMLAEMCAISPDGARLFTEEQAESLADAAPEVVELIAAKAMQLSGMKGAEEKKSGADPEREFLFELALALGRTVAELGHTLGSSELDEWREYARRHPFGVWRDNAHAGLIAAAILNQSRRKGSRPFTFNDFMLRPAQEERRGRMRSIFGLLKSIAKKRDTHD